MSPGTAGTVPASLRERQRTGFRHSVAEYAAARPGYPVAAVRWALAPHSRDVLDLGAGTGKLTEVLTGMTVDGRRLSVTALEPLEEMYDELTRQVPGCTALRGRAEEIPLPDNSVDTVLVGHAFHWFDADAAFAEISRVLRPGGRAGLLWNLRDDSVEWVARLTDLISLGADDSTSCEPFCPFPGTATLTPPVRGLFPYSQVMTPELLLSLVRSRGYVNALPEQERTALLDRVSALVAEHPDLAGRTTFELPYQTEVWLSYRRG